MKLPLCFLSIIPTAAAVLGDVITVPDTPNGNSSTVIFGNGPNVSLRYQQVYSASAFSAVSQAGGLITQIAFRFDNPQGLLGVVVSNIQINFSITPRAVDSLSTTFGLNVGPGDTVVFGPNAVGWPGGSLPAQLTLTSPFLYNPGMGNLLMDMRIYNTGLAIGIGMYDASLDASNVTGDPVSPLYAFGVDSVTGTADTAGLVTAFTVRPIPEPSTGAVAMFGVLFILGRRLHSTTQKSKEEKAMALQTFEAYSGLNQIDPRNGER